MKKTLKIGDKVVLVDDFMCKGVMTIGDVSTVIEIIEYFGNKLVMLEHSKYHISINHVEFVK